MRASITSDPDLWKYILDWIIPSWHLKVTCNGSVRCVFSNCVNIECYIDKCFFRKSVLPEDHVSQQLKQRNNISYRNLEEQEIRVYAFRTP